MSSIDWIVLVVTLFLIVGIGIWKSYGQKDLDSYFLGNKSLPWWQVMFSVMATQASAITFLSGPGQAFTDGMRFIQIYFGMPIAIIVICAFFAPVYHKLNVYTAYEYLERRFDSRVRAFTAFLFLVQRGLAAGLTIYAPSLVLSSLLGWNIYITNSVMGILVISYTLSGGSKAVAYTQFQQMMVIFFGMFFSAYIILTLMPAGVGMYEALTIAGKAGRLNAIVTEFKWSDKYNIWSGLIGGFFLALSYFGTDQSQVGRYLAGKSSAQATKGLLMSAIVKIPMQFGILLIGALLYVFYIFQPQPLIFNQSLTDKVMKGNSSEEYAVLQQDFQKIEAKHRVAAEQFLNSDDEAVKEEAVLQMNLLEKDKKEIRKTSKELIKSTVPGSDTNDVNYIFLFFVLKYLPVGFVGLLIAVIFSASWSSTSSELNALSSIVVIDFYKRFFRKEKTGKHYVNISRMATAFWGILAIGFGFLASHLGSLIEAVNLLGSLFYGTMLGVFVCAFFFKKLDGVSVFTGAIISQLIIFWTFIFYADELGYLWLNFLGCLNVVLISAVASNFVKRKA